MWGIFQAVCNSNPSESRNDNFLFFLFWDNGGVSLHTPQLFNYLVPPINSEIKLAHLYYSISYLIPLYFPNIFACDRIWTMISHQFHFNSLRLFGHTLACHFDLIISSFFLFTIYGPGVDQSKDRSTAFYTCGQL